MFRRCRRRDRHVMLGPLAAVWLALAPSCGDGPPAQQPPAAFPGPAGLPPAPNETTGAAGHGAEAAPTPLPAAVGNANGNSPPAAPVAAGEDPLAGTWWGLLPEQGWLAMRLGVSASDDNGTRTARWITFDWSASSDEGSLQRRTKPVAVTLRNGGEALVVEGPSPMLTEKGEPNGHRGTWRLDLRAVNLPGEPLRYAGRAFHTELTPPEGTPAELVRGFRAWNR